MSNLPDIVRQRLAAPSAGNAGVDHPDADLLNAFAERRLAAPERERVLTHLDACAECREIVALATPEEVSTQPVYTPAGARSWWSVRSYQYGAVAAVLAVVAVGLVMLRPNERSAVTYQAAKLEPIATKPQASPPAADGYAPVARAKAAEPKSDVRAFAGLQSAPQKKTGEAKAQHAFGGGSIVVQTPTAQPPKELDKLAESRDARVGPPPPAPADRVAVAGARSDQEVPAVTAADLPAVAGKAGAAMQTAPAANAAEAQARVAMPGKVAARKEADNEPTKDAAAETVEVTSAANAVEMQPGVVAGNFKVTPQRTAKQSALPGALAKTEEDKQKALARDPKYNARQVIWRINSGRLQRLDTTRNAYDDVSVAGTSRLSIVATLGTEVWVGGTDGTLYYSNDQGAPWIPVQTGALSKDATFTGLTPTALRSVEVHLSNGERWRSADGGASWSKYE